MYLETKNNVFLGVIISIIKHPQILRIKMVRFHSEPFLEILNLCVLPGLQKLIFE